MHVGVPIPPVPLRVEGHRLEVAVEAHLLEPLLVLPVAHEPHRRNDDPHIPTRQQRVSAEEASVGADEVARPPSLGTHNKSLLRTNLLSCCFFHRSVSLLLN